MEAVLEHPEQAAGRAPGELPLDEGEPTYEGIRDPGNAAGLWQGHEAWLNLTSGGMMGVVYGAGGLWQWKLFPDEPGWPAWVDGPGRSWREAMRQPGSAHAGRVGQALSGYDTTDMTRLPDVSPQAVGRTGELYGGSAARASGTTTSAAAASSRREGRGVRVSLTGLASALPLASSSGRWPSPGP